MLYIW